MRSLPELTLGILKDDVPVLLVNLFPIPKPVLPTDFLFLPIVGALAVFSGFGSGVIGSGNLGLSIAKGLVYNNTYTSLYLTKRDLSAIEKWKEYNNIKITSNNQEAVKNADIVIFTVQPMHLQLLRFPYDYQSSRQ